MDATSHFVQALLTYPADGWPRPDFYTPLDPPDDCFRIRLICVLLETCGTYYEKGPAKKKLDFFLNFFQYYLRTKESVTIDIEYDVKDIFGLLRPQWNVPSSLEEAGAAFLSACTEQDQATAPDRPSTPQENRGEPDGLDGDLERDVDGHLTPDGAQSSEGEEAEVRC